MWVYYLRLAARSLKRNPVLTSLMVLAIGLGIGASMTMITVLHVMSGDPLPGRSAYLYYPHLNPLPSNFQTDSSGPDWSDDFTWTDAMALLKAHKADRQAVMSGGTVLVRHAKNRSRPYYANGRYTTQAFFSMFGLPFVAGSGWSIADDQANARVVVLSSKFAQELLGTTDCVGKSVRLSGHEFRVIGVVTDWQPEPLFYQDGTHVFEAADRFFLPLSTAIDLDLMTNGNQAEFCSGMPNPETSGCMTWLQVWVELKTPAKIAAYRQFLMNYAAQQKAIGRFQRPIDGTRLYSLMGWLAHKHLIPTDIKLQLWLSLGFLFVCILNIVALLLAKFLQRSNEISVRRALGARRRDIFAQFSIEAGLIGLVGGALGLGIAQLGLWNVRHRPDAYAHLAQMDIPTLSGTFALALISSLLAGMLPAWRACRIAPATLLKTQ